MEHSWRRSALRLLAGLSTVLVTACAGVGPFALRCNDAQKSTELNCPVFETAHNYADEAAGRDAASHEWSAAGSWQTGAKLGIALSGGGSKAAPVAVGVLAGLADSGLLLPQGKKGTPEDVAISSVSGGGYAAYHLFSQLAWYRTHHPAEHPKATIERAYRDCLERPRGHFDAALLDALKDSFCGEAIAQISPRALKSPEAEQQMRKARVDPKTGRLTNAEQFKLKCGQDLMQPGKCSFDGDGALTIFGEAEILVPTVLALPAHHFFNTLFDAGTSLSPSREAYKYGIGLTYGSVAVRDSHLADATSTLAFMECEDDDVTGPPADWAVPFRPKTVRCDRVTLPPHHDDVLVARNAPSFYLAPQTLKFEDVAALRSDPDAPTAPFWIIQATATEYRSVFGWFIDPERNIPADTFEITPNWYGSSRYGFMKGAPDMNVLDATTAAAAFFDANQQAIRNGGAKAAIGMLLHTLNVDWGLDIPNYNVKKSRLSVHRSLPFPLYWIDSMVAQNAVAPEQRDKIRSAFIRLNDGGNSDDTGAYALIRRGVRTVVMVDAAEDGAGHFGDICELATALRRGRAPLYLSIPGLSGFDKDCGPDRSYDLFSDWQHDIPVLLGCVGPNEKNPCVATSASERGHVTRLVIVKLHVDRAPDAIRKAIEGGGEVKQCVQGGWLYRAGPPPLNCSGRTPGTPEPADKFAQCVRALPCEVERFFVDESSWRNFPQNGTVSTTMNSGPGLYTASRDLARHHISMAKEVIQDAMQKGAKQFLSNLQQQCEKQVPVRVDGAYAKQPAQSQWSDETGCSAERPNVVLLAPHAE